MDASPPRRLAAALLGTGLLIVFGSTSGAHLNPAVTFAPPAVRRFPWREVGPYRVARLVGGLLGALPAAVAHDLLGGPRAAEPVAEPPQGTRGDVAGRRVSEREDGVGPAPGRIPQQAGDTDVRAGRRG